MAGHDRMHSVRMKGVLLHRSANSPCDRSPKRRISCASGMPEAYRCSEMWLQTKGRWMASEKTLPQSMSAVAAAGSSRTVDRHVPRQENGCRDSPCELLSHLAA